MSLAKTFQSAFPLFWLGAVLTSNAWAASCKTQAQMTDAERGSIVAAAKTLAAEVAAGNVAGAKSNTVPSVAANFDAIANSIGSLAPEIAKATLTVDAVYELDASDAKASDPETQFFCGAADPTLHVTFTIPQLPPGKYAFAMVHATGVPKPQRLSMLLQDLGSGWKLAGFFPRPLTAAGHDGLWYWRQARVYAAKKQVWNAYFYDQTALFLLAPVNFLSSGNLDTLAKETDEVRPRGLPGEAPMVLQGSGGESYSITNLHTDDALGGLDLVVRYTSPSNADPAAARVRAVGAMGALVAAHPELRTAFHGIWAFSDAPNQAAFALEQPMGEIK